MIKWLKYILVGTIVSFFYFPISFTFLPGVNTKNATAVFGLVCFLFIMVKKREFTIPKELFILLLLSSFVSIISYFSITFNQTPDVTYVTYIRSAVIWLSGALGVCVCIWFAHGRINLALLTNYLAGVCVFQCVMAMLIHFVPAVETFVDATVDQGQWLLKDMNRLYGVGASLDVGGSRFSAALIAIAFCLGQDKEKREGASRFILALSFAIITVIGNFIARTTIIGVALGLFYILAFENWRVFTKEFRSESDELGKSKSTIWTWLAILAIVIPIGITLYRTSEEFYDMMRFGFEGFFSLVEEGEWDVDSNEKLKSMIVWPEELRTWIIGDGYFANQRNDANYIGDATTEGFYMGTDIGYLRYIFYFGVIGLLAISSVMIYACWIGIKAFPEYKAMILLALLAGFIIWLKVSTDLFPFYSLLASAAFFNQELELLSPETTDIQVESDNSE